LAQAEGNVVGHATMPPGCAAVQPLVAPAVLASVLLTAVARAQPLAYTTDNAVGTARFAPLLIQGQREPGSRTAGAGAHGAFLAAAFNVSTCPLGCCGRGLCEAGGCRCVSGWHGPACGTTPAVWAAAINKRRLRLIAEARGRHSQAEKSLSLAQMLRNAQLVGSVGYNAALAQAQLLERDVQALASAAEATERQAHDPALQPEMQDLVQVGGALAARSCAVAATYVKQAQRAANHTGTSRATHPIGVPARPAMLALSKKQPQQTAGNSGYFGSFYVPSHAGQGKQSEVRVNLSSKDFGVETDNMPTKAKKDEKSGCEDSCNFRGLCSDGMCFCQPGYYGSTCDIVAESEKDTVSLITALFIAGACLCTSFLVTFLIFFYRYNSYRKRENEKGFK